LEKNNFAKNVVLKHRNTDYNQSKSLQIKPTTKNPFLEMVWEFFFIYKKRKRNTEQIIE